MILAAVVGAGVVAVIVFLIVNALGGSSGGTTASKGQLSSYTRSVVGLHDALGPTVVSMADLSSGGPAPGSHLKDEAAAWTQSLQQLQGSVSNQPAPGPLKPVQAVFGQVVAQYSAAAKTFLLAATAPHDQRSQLLALAGSQRAQGDALWDAAVGVLNQQRAAVGLSAMASQPPSVAPSVAPSPQPSSPGGAGGRGAKQGGSKKSSQKQHG